MRHICSLFTSLGHWDNCKTALAESIDSKQKVQQTLSVLKGTGRDPPPEEKINEGNESDDEPSDIFNDFVEKCHDVDGSNSL